MFFFTSSQKLSTYQVEQEYIPVEWQGQKANFTLLLSCLQSFAKILAISNMKAFAAQLSVAPSNQVSVWP